MLIRHVTVIWCNTLNLNHNAKQMEMCEEEIEGPGFNEQH